MFWFVVLKIWFHGWLITFAFRSLVMQKHGRRTWRRKSAHITAARKQTQSVPVLRASSSCVVPSWLLSCGMVPPHPGQVFSISLLTHVPVVSGNTFTDTPKACLNNSQLFLNLAKLTIWISLHSSPSRHKRVWPKEDRGDLWLRGIECLCVGVLMCWPLERPLWANLCPVTSGWCIRIDWSGIIYPKYISKYYKLGWFSSPNPRAACKTLTMQWACLTHGRQAEVLHTPAKVEKGHLSIHFWAPGILSVFPAIWAWSL